MRILLVEDDGPLRASVAALLESKGWTVDAAASGERAVDRLRAVDRESLPDLMIVDIRLGGISGVELIERLARQDHLPTTLVISGQASAAEAVRAIQLGAVDFLEKPFSDERLLQSIRLACRVSGLERRVADLERRSEPFDRLIGESEAMLELKQTVERVASTDARVLILGESGSGKELVAEALHCGSRRADGPFLRVNCAALSAELIESELFGHAAGAFTGAKRDRRGLFEAADGGTLLLDEIGDMEERLQRRLLRVLEEGAVRRVGEETPRPVDVRVLAATHQAVDPRSVVAATEFEQHGPLRRDLYYRLAHVPIHVPPLRERGGDAVLLADHFLEQFARRHERPVLRVGEEVAEALVRYPWPGNVRELRGVCERLAILADPPLRVADLPADLLATPCDAATGISVAGVSGAGETSLRAARSAFERRHILEVLQGCGWNFAQAARQLEVGRTHLHAKAAQLGLQRPHGVQSRTPEDD